MGALFQAWNGNNLRALLELTRRKEKLQMNEIDEKQNDLLGKLTDEAVKGIQKDEAHDEAIRSLESKAELLYEDLKTSSEDLNTIYEELIHLRGSEIDREDVDKAQSSKIDENKRKIESNLRDIDTLAGWFESYEKSYKATRILATVGAVFGVLSLGAIFALVNFTGILG